MKSPRSPVLKPAGAYTNLINKLPPVVVLSGQLQAEVQALVDYATGECQWFHAITVATDEKTGQVFYHLEGMYIPVQEVAAATVESPATGLTAILDDLKNVYRKGDGTVDYQKMQDEVLGKLHCWCHSHVEMACSPSGTDNTTFNEWCKMNRDQGVEKPVIMLIANKRGDVFTRIYDPTNGIYCENATIQINHIGYSTSHITDLAKTRLKPKTWGGYSSTWNNNSGFFGEHRSAHPKQIPALHGKSGTTTGGTVATKLSFDAMSHYGRGLVAENFKKETRDSSMKAFMQLVSYFQKPPASLTENEAGRLVKFEKSFLQIIDNIFPTPFEVNVFIAVLDQDSMRLREWVAAANQAPPNLPQVTLWDYMLSCWVHDSQTFLASIGYTKMLLSATSVDYRTHVLQAFLVAMFKNSPLALSEK